MDSRGGIEVFGQLHENDPQFIADWKESNQFRGFRMGSQKFCLGDFAKIKKNGCPDFPSQLEKKPKYIQILRVFQTERKKKAMVLWFIKAEHCTQLKLPEGVPPLEEEGELLLDRRAIPDIISLSVIQGSTTVTNIKTTDSPKKFLKTRRSFFVVRFGLYEKRGTLYVKPALIPSTKVSVNGNEKAIKTGSRQAEPSRTRQNETSPQRDRTRNDEAPRTRHAETSPQRNRTRQAKAFIPSPPRTRNEASNSPPARVLGVIPESQDITDDEDFLPLPPEEPQAKPKVNLNKRKLFIPSSQDVSSQPKTPEKPVMKPYHPALGADFDAGPSEAVKLSPRRRVNEQSPSRSPYRFAVLSPESPSAEKRTRSQTRYNASPERPISATTQWAAQDLTYSPDKSPVRLRIFKKQPVPENRNTGQNTRQVTAQGKEMAKKLPSLFGDSQHSSIDTPIDLPFPKKAPTKSVLANARPVLDDDDDNELFFDEVPQRQQPKQKKITEYSKPVVEETTLSGESSDESTNELANQVQQTRISLKMPRFVDDSKNKSADFQRITRSGASNEPTPSTSGIVTQRNRPVASVSGIVPIRNGSNRPTASLSDIVTSKNSDIPLANTTQKTAVGNSKGPTASLSDIGTSKNSDRLTANTTQKTAVGNSKGPTASLSDIGTSKSNSDKPTASTSQKAANSSKVPTASVSGKNSDRPTASTSQSAGRNITIGPSTSGIVTRRNSIVEPTTSSSRTATRNGTVEPVAAQNVARKITKGPTQTAARSVPVSPTKSTESSLSEEEEEEEAANEVRDGFSGSESDHDDRLMMCDVDQKKERQESPKKCLFIEVNRPMPKPAIVTKSTAFEDSEDEERPLTPPSNHSAVRKSVLPSCSPVRVVMPAVLTSPTRMSAMPCNTSPRKSAMNSTAEGDDESRRKSSRSVPNGDAETDCPPRKSVTNSGGRLNLSLSERSSGGRLSFSETNNRNQLNLRFSGTATSPDASSASRLGPDMNPSVRLSPLSQTVLQKHAHHASSADQRESHEVTTTEKVPVKSPNPVRQLFSNTDKQSAVSSSTPQRLSSTSVKETLDQVLNFTDNAVPGCSGLGKTQSHSDVSSDSDSENPLPRELRREMRSSPKKLTNFNLNTSRQELLDCLTTPASPNHCELDHNNSRLKLITSLEGNEVEEQHPVMKLFDKNLSMRTSLSENEDSDSRYSAGRKSLLTNSAKSSPSISPLPSASTILKARTNSSFDSSSYHTARSHTSSNTDSPLIIDSTPDTVTCRKRKRNSLGPIRVDLQDSSFSASSTPATIKQSNQDSDNESSESVIVFKKKKRSSVKDKDSQDSSITEPPTGQGVIEDSDSENSESVIIHKKKSPVKDKDSQDLNIAEPSTPPTGQGVIEDSDDESSPIIPRTVRQLIPSAANMREVMRRKLAALESEGTPNLDVDTCGFEDNIGDTQLDDPSYSEFIFGSADGPRKSPRKLNLNKPNSLKPSTSKDNDHSKPGTSKDNNHSKPGTSKDNNHSKPGTSKDNNHSKLGTSKDNCSKTSTSKTNTVKGSKITEHAAKAKVSTAQLADLLNEDTNSMTPPKKFTSPLKLTNQSKAAPPARKHSSDIAMAESSSDNEDIQNIHGQPNLVVTNKPSSEKVNYFDVNLPALEGVSINTQLKMFGLSTNKSSSDTSSIVDISDTECDENSFSYKMKMAERKELQKLQEFSDAMRVSPPKVARKSSIPEVSISPTIQSPVAPDQSFSFTRKSSTTSPDTPEKSEPKFVPREKKEQKRRERRQSLRSNSTQEPIDQRHLRRSSVSSRRNSVVESSGNVTPRKLRARTPAASDSEESSPEKTHAKRGRSAKFETVGPREQRTRGKTPSRATSPVYEESSPEKTPSKRGRPAKVETVMPREKRTRGKTPSRATSPVYEESSPEKTPSKRGRPAKVETVVPREKRTRGKTPSRATSPVYEESSPEKTPSKRGRPAKVETAVPREKRKTPSRATSPVYVECSSEEESSPEVTPAKKGRTAKVETVVPQEKRKRGRPPGSQKGKGPKGMTKKVADKRTSSRFLSPTKVATVEEQEMPGRETEMASILAFVQRKIEESSGGCMYISGVPGTGKTASVSQVILQLQKMVEEDELPEFKLVKASGMELTQPLQLFSLMARELMDVKLSPNLAQTQLAKYFANKDKNRPPTLLIIDELDMLCTRRQDVVYSVFDWPSQTHARLIVLAIANTMDLPERLLKGRVTSRLGLTRLSFKPYTFDQLQQIVMVKLSEAKKFDKDALQLVARKVASVSGDARRAMDICRRAAEVAGVGKLVEMPHVMSALGEMLSSPIAESVRGCSDLAKHLLRCLLSEMKRTGLEESTLKAVFLTMKSTASFHNIPMCSLTQVSETVAKLASSRLLRAVDAESGSLGQPLALSVSADELHYALNAEN